MTQCYILTVLTTQANQPARAVISQPTATIHTPGAQSGFGNDALIYCSVLSTVCCGLMTCLAFIPGLFALVLSWEVSVQSSVITCCHK